MKKLLNWVVVGLSLAAILLVAYYIFQTNGFSIGNKIQSSNVPQVSSPTKSPKNDLATVQTVVLDKQAVLNTEYKINTPDDPNGTIKLVNGSYEKEADWGRLSIEGDTNPTFGDLDSDGVKEAITVVSSYWGGTGTFHDLHILKVVDGKIVDVAQTPLGDRIGINSVSIKDNKIILDVIAHGPNDPMCCPTSKETWIYTFSKDGNGNYQLNK